MDCRDVYVMAKRSGHTQAAATLSHNACEQASPQCIHSSSICSSMTYAVMLGVWAIHFLRSQTWSQAPSARGHT